MPDMHAPPTQRVEDEVEVDLITLACVECGSAWDSPAERWRLKVLFDEQPPLCAAYCPACHAREFDPA